MKTVKLLLAVISLSFGLSTLPMEYTKPEQEKKAQKESTQEQNNVPSLVDLCLDTVSDKILHPLCKQSTVNTLETTKKEINNTLVKLPIELQEKVKDQVSTNHGWQLDLLTKKMDLEKILNLSENQSIISMRANNQGQLACQIAEKEIVIIDGHTATIVNRITVNHTIIPSSWYFGSHMLICVCNNSHAIYIHDLSQHTTKKITTDNPIYLVISPDEKCMAGLEIENKKLIHVWNITTGDKLLTIPTTDIYCNFDFTSSSQLRTTSHQGIHDIKTCKIWDITRGKNIYTLEDYFTCFASTKKLFAYSALKPGEITHQIVSPKAYVVILDNTTGEKVTCQIPGDDYRIASLQFFPDAKLLFVGGKNLYIIDTKTGKLITTVHGIIRKSNAYEHYYYFTHFWYTNNNHYLLVLAQPLESHFIESEAEIIIVDAEDTQPLILYVFDTKTGQCIQQIQINSDLLHSYLGAVGLFLKNKIGFIETSYNEESIFSCKPDTLDILPLEYALKDAESKDDDESRIKAQQLREQIKKFYPDKSEEK